MIRSSIISLQFTNKAKLEKLSQVIKEYSEVVNFYINHYWELKRYIAFKDLTKENRPIPDKKNDKYGFWFYRSAADEAKDMINSAIASKASKPVHYGKRMILSCDSIVRFIDTYSKEFDSWLKIKCGINLSLPLKFHKQYNDLNKLGKRKNYFIITPTTVAIPFEIDVPQINPKPEVGVDTGINSLASTSTGNQYGKDIKNEVNRIKRCKHNSKGWKTARKHFKHRCNIISKELINKEQPGTVIVEDLRNLSRGTKKQHRVSKEMRRTLGAWAYRYWLGSLERASEWRGSTFSSVSAAYTSQMCPACGHTERKNRVGEKFLCRKCGFSGNADIIAAGNILSRFLSAKDDFSPSVKSPIKSAC